MVILLRIHQPDNFEYHNSLKFSFINIRGLHSNFVGYESLLESNSSDILALSETNLDDSIDSGNFSVRGYLSLIRNLLLVLFPKLIQIIFFHLYEQCKSS